MPDDQPEVEPVELRRDPDNPRRAAYKTGDNVTAGDWFVFTAENGGGYTDGVAEHCEDWPVV
jgi:hypothetical protein